MIYAVVVEPSNRVRGYYTEEGKAQEHADFLNKYEKTVTYREPLTAKVITILQKSDKEKTDSI